VLLINMVVCLKLTKWGDRVRKVRGGYFILLLQTLAEFSNVAIRKARIPI
jgi:hypothetical protein